jgi:hypothetical protein
MNETSKNNLVSVAFDFRSRLNILMKSLPKPYLALLEASIVLLISFSLLALVQFSTMDMPDNDGYYHIKLAYLMRTEGLKPDFNWLPLTILNAREFYDHHFLFHVGLMPFTFGDLQMGAKWAAVFFASLAFLSVWWLLYRQRIRYAWLWAFSLLAVSEAFIDRMSITRAQSLSLAVLALGVHLLLTRQYKWLLPLGFAYVWMYDAFPLLFVISGVYVSAVWMIERRLNSLPLIYAGLGIMLGLLINPYFPHDIIFAIRHLVPKLLEATNISVGNEWYPYSTLQLLKNSPLALGSFLFGVVVLGFTSSRIRVRTATSLFLAILFCLMLFQARRFVEYFPAFALIFAAFAWTNYEMERSTIEGGPVESPVKGSQDWTLLAWVRKPQPVLVIFPVLALGMIFTIKAARDSIQDSKPYSLYAGASAWLIENSPQGSRVFQTDWDDFPRLFFYNTHNTYLVGLDPTYMRFYNADLYDEWVEITRGEVEQPSKVIFERFGAQYVVSDLRHRDFLEVAGRDVGLLEVYQDDLSVVYQVMTGN